MSHSIMCINIKSHSNGSERHSEPQRCHTWWHAASRRLRLAVHVVKDKGSSYICDPEASLCHIWIPGGKKFADLIISDFWLPWERWEQITYEYKNPTFTIFN